MRFKSPQRIMKSICPLLQDPQQYFPDTIDLTSNVEQRNYWLPCLENMVRNFVEKAAVLNPHKPNATEKAEHCFQLFHNLVESSKQNPQLLRPLSVRTLLEFNEKTLRENCFKDAWFLQKEKETVLAFREFHSRLTYIDQITDFGEKWLELVKGVLAGNMFDWGARAVTDILEVSVDFNLSDAMDRIEKRPWFKDDLESWIKKLQVSSYKNIVIFVDNAGIDFILGIMPFTREFLKQNTQVVLSANTHPALNDITSHELKECLCTAAKYCPIIESALVKGLLVGVENGQSGPCLDLANLNPELCNLMTNTDLIVLEGMGRAIHTNFKAKFNVDSLKLAIIKNEWLAKSLGAQQFAVVFEYQPAPSPLST